VHKSMKWFMTAIACIVFVGFARPAFAQKAEVSAGYNWFAAKSAGETDWEKFPKGWYFDFAHTAKPLGIVGQVTGNYKTDDEGGIDVKGRVHTFMGGVRGSSKGNGKVSAYGQVLAGITSLRFSAPAVGVKVSENDFAIQIGGGVNIKGNGKVGGRVGIDYLRVMAKDDGEVTEGDSANVFRICVGVTIGLGGK